MHYEHLACSLRMETKTTSPKCYFGVQKIPRKLTRDLGRNAKILRPSARIARTATDNIPGFLLLLYAAIPMKHTHDLCKKGEELQACDGAHTADHLAKGHHKAGSPSYSFDFRPSGCYNSWRYAFQPVPLCRSSASGQLRGAPAHYKTVTFG